ncbi:MAG: hypothetical protein PHG80_11215 [Methanoregulaceae archaeon]|nr:hypothetical protein [Methanoregulaceae archaeon]
MEIEWCVGRKNIMNFLGLSTWNAVKFLKREGLPVRYLPNGKPVLIQHEATEWLIAYDELKKDTQTTP